MISKVDKIDYLLLGLTSYNLISNPAKQTWNLVWLQTLKKWSCARSNRCVTFSGTITLCSLGWNPKHFKSLALMVYVCKRWYIPSLSFFWRKKPCQLILRLTSDLSWWGLAVDGPLSTARHALNIKNCIQVIFVRRNHNNIKDVGFQL